MHTDRKHLSNSYQPELALNYLRRADSISSRIGLTTWNRKNKINIATCLYETGDTAEAKHIMEGLLNDPVIQSDFGTYNIVLRNAFIHTGKSCYIHKAYRQSMEKDSTIPLNAVYEILLSRHYIQGAEKRDTALADLYGAKALARIEDVDDHEVKAHILISATQKFVRQGKHDSAYICQSRYIEEKEASEAQTPLEVSRIHNLKEINRIEAEKREGTPTIYCPHSYPLDRGGVPDSRGDIHQAESQPPPLRIEEQKHINESLKSQPRIEHY